MRILLFRAVFFLGATLSCITLSNSTTTSANSTSICVYSKDRPMQLYAFLESLYKYLYGNFAVTVIYKASSLQFKEGYEKCFQDFKEKELSILAQDNYNLNDFKPLTFSVLNRTDSSYILFAVDDIIIKDHIDLSDCIYHLKSNGAYSFHLRLGKNITYSYTARQPSLIPKHSFVNNTIISWQFVNGNGEWCYPNSLDMCLYENNTELRNLIGSLEFYSPNTLEAAWANSAWHTGVLGKYGLCYIDSKIVNVPLNVTQQDWVTSYNMGYSAEFLLELFNKGFKINIDKYYQLNNSAPHHEIKPTLIYRTKKSKRALGDKFKIDFYEAMKHSRYFNETQAEKEPNWQMLNKWYQDALSKEFSDTDPFTIPPIFHLIWLGSKVPERYHILAQSLKELHPYAQVRIWTDSDIQEFNFTNKSALDYEVNYGARSDVFRYEILNKYGGIYLDGDFDIYQPLDDLLCTCSFFAGLAYDRELVLYNGLIASTPSNPIIKACLETIKSEGAKFDLDSIMIRTGPYHFTKCVLKEGPQAPGITAIFPVAFFYPWPNYELHNNQQEHIDSFKQSYSFTVHKWAASWHSAFKS